MIAMNYYAAGIAITHHEYNGKAVLVFSSDNMLDEKSLETKIKVMRAFQKKNPSFEFEHYCVSGDELSNILEAIPNDFDWSGLELKFINYGLWINVENIQKISKEEFNLLSLYATELLTFPQHEI